MKWFTRLPAIIKLMMGVICLAAIVLASLCIWVFVRETRREQARHQELQENWERRMASPIPEEVVEDLCNRELVPVYVADCEDPDVVILYGSIPDIVRANVDFENDTHDDVAGIFGQYEYCQMQLDCSDRDSYRCSYRLHAYDFFIYYDCAIHRIVEIHWNTPEDS
jgi:hypothetical protein